MKREKGRQDDSMAKTLATKPDDLRSIPEPTKWK